MRLLKLSWDSALEPLRIVIFVDKREPFEFDLIDILHDVGRNRSEYWIFFREIGIKVVDITFRFLWENGRRGYDRASGTGSRSRRFGGSIEKFLWEGKKREENGVEWYSRFLV